MCQVTMLPVFPCSSKCMYVNTSLKNSQKTHNNNVYSSLMLHVHTWVCCASCHLHCFSTSSPFQEPDSLRILFLKHSRRKQKEKIHLLTLEHDLHVVLMTSHILLAMYSHLTVFIYVHVHNTLCMCTSTNCPDQLICYKHLHISVSF